MDDKFHIKKNQAQISRSFRKTLTKVNMTKSNCHEMNIDLYYTIKNIWKNITVFIHYQITHCLETTQLTQADCQNQIEFGTPLTHM